MEIGTRIMIGGKLVRRHTGPCYNGREWEYVIFNELKEALFLGNRNLSNGQARWYDDHCEYTPTQNLKVALVKTLDKRSNPFYCPIDRVLEKAWIDEAKNERLVTKQTSLPETKDSKE